MSQSLGDVLAKRNYGEPPEIKVIKEFVHDQIGITPSVSITTAGYVVRVPSAAAAGTLRTKLYQLQQELGPQRRVLIRIG